MHELFAHAESLHDESTSTLEHSLTQPYVAIPLFIGILLAMYLVMSNVLKWPVPKMLLAYMPLFFIVGVLMYSLVPAISAFSISAGILLALFFSLTAIAK